MKFSFHFRNKNQILSVDEVLETLISTERYFSSIKFIGSREMFNTLKLLLSLEPELSYLKIHYRNSGKGISIVLVEHTN